jgi:cellulose synthase/poly-beta-1,6-N-acetylglucosamine synthase-like glycosyltransferase
MRAVRQCADRRAGMLLLLGLAGVAWHNWRQWQRDKALLAHRADPAPLPPLEEWPALPLVSVLVAAWNEADMIERHLESFLQLRYLNKELVLCAGGDDGTYELAKRYGGPQVTVLAQQPGEGKQRALERSFAQSRGEVIFLTDADCLLSDEAFERTLYLVARDEEEASTGTSRPLPEQLGNPFLVSQASTQLYSSLHLPDYWSGLLGRNAALRRELLQRSRGLAAPAATGTDYVLAKELVRSGARIRQVPHSQVFTRYPTGARPYLQQQRRWLRNVALHGQHYGADDEVRASLRTSLVGVAMLVTPVIAFLAAPWLLAAWGVVAAQALFARLRYLAFGTRLLGRPVRAVDVVSQGPLFLLDLVGWAQPLLDYARRGPMRWER